MKVSRRLPILCALAPVLVAATSFATAEAERPNVILITLDTVRADFLSCYGSTNGSTPAVDQLAAAGTLFEDAASSSGLTPAVCIPP
mgnify:CR=1 FL=1